MVVLDDLVALGTVISNLLLQFEKGLLLHFQSLVVREGYLRSQLLDGDAIVSIDGTKVHWSKPETRPEQVDPLCPDFERHAHLLYQRVPGDHIVQTFLGEHDSLVWRSTSPPVFWVFSTTFVDAPDLLVELVRRDAQPICQLLFALVWSPHTSRKFQLQCIRPVGGETQELFRIWDLEGLDVRPRTRHPFRHLVNFGFNNAS